MIKLISKFTHRTKIFTLSLLFLFASLFLYESLSQNDGSELEELNTQVINSISSQNLMANMPLRFIPNKGQAGNEAEYHVQAAGHTVLFHDEKIVLRREESIDKKNEIVLEFKEANKNPIIEGNERLTGVANFFKGSDPTKWQTNLPTYSSIMYKELYPGIDMGYIGEEGNLESEFYVSARTDYHKIKIEYSGIKSKRIRDDGALLLETELGELIEKAPYAYQDIDGVREEIEAEYTLL
ncbi:MAG: hypothetical protein KAI45_01350, partial [Melioribacteraceae bacterium]|nr:hypothetical protein [Melioribacteraceae bacterium]